MHAPPYCDFVTPKRASVVPAVRAPAMRMHTTGRHAAVGTTPRRSCDWVPSRARAPQTGERNGGTSESLHLSARVVPAPVFLCWIFELGQQEGKPGAMRLQGKKKIIVIIILMIISHEICTFRSELLTSFCFGAAGIASRRYKNSSSRSSGLIPPPHQRFLHLLVNYYFYFFYQNEHNFDGSSLFNFVACL